MLSKGFWKGKRVLITGHTGFKGSWLSLFLESLEAEITGYSLEPYTPKDVFVLTGLAKRINHIIGDIRDYENLREAIQTSKPEIVFHLAAQPLVLYSYKDPKTTYDTNIGGTVNLLESCRIQDTVKVIVNITSDKCYLEKITSKGYKEEDPLGGKDPYSSSKAACEMVTQGYLNSFFNPENFDVHGKSLSSVRAGNVIGGGDWQKNRLIPDCVKALESKEKIVLRNPKHIRPWQHVIEPIYGYVLLAEKMWNNSALSGAWNFGPDAESFKDVKQVVSKFIDFWGAGKYIELSNKEILHESKLLKLNAGKARSLLSCKPVWKFEDAINVTVDWYKIYPYEDMHAFSMNQIEQYKKNIYK